MGLRNSTQVRTVAYPSEVVWSAVQQACQANGWKNVGCDNLAKILDVKSGASIVCPLGVGLRISLAAVAQGTEVAVEAQGKGQLVDYGQSSREVSRFFEALAVVLNGCAAGQYSGGSSVVNDGVPAGGTSSSQGILCPQCGLISVPGAKFCNGCGQKLEQAAASDKCLYCGAAMPMGAKFCGKCGKAVNG